MSDTPGEHRDHAAHADHHGHPPARPYTRLWQLLRSERRELWMVLVFAAVVACLSLATPIAVETLVNTVAFGVLLWPVVAIALVLAACLGLAGAVRAVQVYVVECIQRRLFVRVVADYARRLPRVRLPAFDRQYGPELANRFFDVLTVQKSLANLLLDGVSLVVAVAVGLVVLAFYHPFLLGFDLVLILFLAVLVFAFGWGGVRTSLHESHAKYDVAGWLEEVPRNLRAFKFAHGRELAEHTADRLAGQYVTARKAHFRVVWRQTVFAITLQVLASTALLGIGGYLVIDRQLTLGQLVAAELIVTLVVASVAKVGKYAETFYDLMSGAEKLGLLTDLPLDREGGEPLPAGGPLAVRVVGVETASGRPLALPADWRVEAGERVAVIGPPGAGKTTLFEVLCELREPDAGRVEFDGVDARVFNPAAARQRIALVGSVSEVFAGTVTENVAAGRADVTPADVRDALRAVGLLEVAFALPAGLDTPLTPDGGPLSGDQAVRLGVARAVVGRPRLLILDGTLDGTLDVRTCPDLLQFLVARSAPWTLLIATADPALIARCDRTLDLSGEGRDLDLIPLTPTGAVR